VKIKREKTQSQIERKLLTALVTSHEFLNQASPILDLSLIEAPHFRLIAEWCLNYYHLYHTAPRQDIEIAYHSWAEGCPDSAESEAIHDLLEDLSASYTDTDPINVPYLIDHLRAYLERKSLQRLQDNVDFALHSGHPEEAKQHVLNYRPVEMLARLGVDPLRETTAWERAFAVSAQPLIELPGDAGAFLNPALVRDGLIGIQGPEKRGKTFWCIEFVVRALQERRRVAFFQVGDLSEHQVMIRLGMYWAERPSRADLCGKVNVPLRIEKPQRGPGPKPQPDEEEAHVEGRIRTFLKPLTKQACIKACQKFMRGCGLSPRKSYLKVSIHPNSSINVRGIMGILDRWEMTEGFIPDLIVVDYADILAPEDGRQIARDQVNDTWKALRRLSQERHCLVISPTQANADSYDRHTQSIKNFSEDKRKLAHVTGMLGLNQTEREKELGLMRLNWLVLRESPFNAHRCLWVGQCLAIGRAYYCATL